MRTQLIAVVALLGLMAPAHADEAIVNPLIVSPTVTLAGALGPGAEAALTARGIATIVDLRTPEEGTEEARGRFEAAGFRYINFPTTADAPDAAHLATFVALVDAESRAPMLMHCASGNRAGMMWGLYQLEHGVPLADVLRAVAPVVTKASLREEIEHHAAGMAPSG